METVYLQTFCQWLLPKISGYIPYLISFTTERTSNPTNIRPFRVNKRKFEKV